MSLVKHRPDEAAQLADRFDALGRFVRLTWDHVAGDPDVSDVEASTVAAAGVLSVRAGARLRLSGGHTVVALAGATGSGKSSLFNALATMQLSATGHLRPTTGAAHACVWGDEAADDLLDWLGVAHRFRRESQLDAHDEVPLRGLVLLDLPDLDSVATGHRLEADRLVGVVDLVVWVLDPQKYADQTVHDEYLRHMGALRDVTVVVFNQSDKLSPADTQRCVIDLARLVEADGLKGVPILATSARTGAGVPQLRGLLEKTIAGRHAALARLEGELDEAVNALVPLVAASPAAESEAAEPLDRAAANLYAGELAEAAGVDAVADEAGRAYRRRSTLPGPFRVSRADRAPRVPPADPAAVAAAVRRLGRVAGSGLPAPWPDQIQTALAGQLTHLPDELGDTLTGARPPLPRRRGWLALRALWWLALLAVLFGAAWLIWAPLDGPQPPRWFGVSAALVLLVAGALVAVVVPLIGRPVARARARRYGERVRRKLRDAATGVARESMAPARVVLRDYDDARVALREAGGSLDRSEDDQARPIDVT